MFKPYNPEEMPVILKPENYFNWLEDYRPHDIQTFLALDQNDNGNLQCCQVQPELNEVTSEGSHLIRPYAYDLPLQMTRSS